MKRPTETPKRIKSIRHLYADTSKECPFGTIHQKRCETCKIAITLYTDEEVKEERGKGNMTVEQFRYACPVHVSAMLACGG